MPWEIGRGEIEGKRDKGRRHTRGGGRCPLDSRKCSRECVCSSGKSSGGGFG